jgi:hypothetical protein
MFEDFSHSQFIKYSEAKAYFQKNLEYITSLEEYIQNQIKNFLLINKEEIINDYNEASYLYPFWKNYPPEERGRQPIGDQYPWIEVGEQVLGPKLSRYFASRFIVRDCGLPAGPDNRYVIQSPSIHDLTEYTDSCWIFIDIKSVGPRDDADHAVMSHNQISGSGNWENKSTGITNNEFLAIGSRASHSFNCAIPPIYVLSSGKILPVVNLIIKPVYKMLNLETPISSIRRGQPLVRIDVAMIPNGILLDGKDGYISKYPGLFFPGKDDKKKDPKKLRARISFSKLREIAPWRHISIDFKNQS